MNRFGKNQFVTRGKKIIENS